MYTKIVQESFTEENHIRESYRENVLRHVRRGNTDLTDFNFSNTQTQSRFTFKTGGKEQIIP